MSKYYNAQRKKNMYDPASKIPFKLSWSKIRLYRDCPRCFYLDRRLGVGRPPGFPFTLNMAVDALLKKEFDVYRARMWPHPLMEKFGLDYLVPAPLPELVRWRNPSRGVQFFHEATGLTITGAIDDLWKKDAGEGDMYYVVDYKATSTIKGKGRLRRATPRNSNRKYD